MNPECGTLNRVPGYSLRRIPQCGKCHTKLPEAAWITVIRQFSVGPILLCLVVVVVGGGVLWALIQPTGSDTNQQAAPTKPAEVAAACAIRSNPWPTWWYTDADEVAPFTIKTAAGANYFVKLVDATSGTPIVSFFIKGGATVTNKVPLGTFTLKYASGTSWCNERELFGSDTSTNEADETFTFDQQPGYTPTKWTVELIRQPGGNLRTHAIPRNRF